MLTELNQNDYDEITLNENSIEGSIKERDCPTPIPESVYICAECNSGFVTQEEVENHIRMYHQEMNWEEKLRRLETELRLEKGQHQDHLNMLEISLRECSGYRQRIDVLEKTNSNFEAEIKFLKEDSNSNEIKIENIKLKKDIEEKDKQIKKTVDKNAEEIKNLKNQNMKTSEALRSAILERENLRENDRIMLNTLDMMKIYVDQLKNKEANLIEKSFKCQDCEFSAKISEDLKIHIKNAHKGGPRDDLETNPKNAPVEGIVYCCTKCKFETKAEKTLTDHIKKKHESNYGCEDCGSNFKSRSRLNENVQSVHKVNECDICNFVSKSRKEVDEHVQSLHNKMFACRECTFEATSKNVLKEHFQSKHSKETVYKCDKCGYESIMENNLNEHVKNKHSQEKSSRSGKGENRKEKVENIPCIYWNHGNCTRGDQCHYAHEEIPACHYQDRCRKYECPLYHFNKTLNTFLGRSPASRNPPKH